MQLPITDSDKEKIIAEYQQRGEEIIKKMLQVVMRAQRKLDDRKYRNILHAMQATS